MPVTTSQARSIQPIQANENEGSVPAHPIDTTHACDSLSVLHKSSAASGAHALIRHTSLSQSISAPCLQIPTKRRQVTFNLPSPVQPREGHTFPNGLTAMQRKTLQERMGKLISPQGLHFDVLFSRLPRATYAHYGVYPTCLDVIALMEIAQPFLSCRSIFNYDYWHLFLPNWQDIGEMQPIVAKTWRTILQRLSPQPLPALEALHLLSLLVNLSLFHQIDLQTLQSIPLYFPHVLNLEIGGFELRSMLQSIGTSPHGLDLLPFCQQCFSSDTSASKRLDLLEQAQTLSLADLKYIQQLFAPRIQTFEEHDIADLVLCGLMLQDSNQQQQAMINQILDYCEVCQEEQLEPQILRHFLRSVLSLPLKRWPIFPHKNI